MCVCRAIIVSFALEMSLVPLLNAAYVAATVFSIAS